MYGPDFRAARDVQKAPLSCDNRFVEDQIDADRKDTSVRLLHSWAADRAVFDDANLVSCAGLIPVMALAEHAGLTGLLDDHVKFTDERSVRAGRTRPGS